MDLLWARRPDLAGLATDALVAAFALSVLLDTFDDRGGHFPGTVREWSRRILQTRPELAEKVYTELMAERLRRQKNITVLIHSIPDKLAAPWRGELAVRLLLDYEPDSISDLQELCLMAAESDHGRRRLAVIAHERIFVESANRPKEDLLWSVVGFALSGERFKKTLAAAAASHPETLVDHQISDSVIYPIGRQDSAARIFSRARAGRSVGSSSFVAAFLLRPKDQQLYAPPD